MSRPAAASIAKIALALLGCLVLLGSAARLTAGSAGAPGGLAVSFSGGVFDRATGGEGPPAMRIRNLEPGAAISGTVTVRNPGPGSRFFWLSQAGLSERLGDAGGRLSDTLQLTILDVTAIGSPASVYRGPATGLGARPLGFLGVGAERTYSFTADLPVTRRPGGGPHPYRGATAAIAYAWHTIAGRPGSASIRPLEPEATKPSRQKPAARARQQQKPEARARARRRDTSAPRLSFSTAGRQQVLRTGTLAVRARCSEACATRADARVSGPDAHKAAVTASKGVKRSHVFLVRLGPKAQATVRRALLSGRVVRIRVAVRTRDQSGNRGRGSYTLRLLPRP